MPTRSVTLGKATRVESGELAAFDVEGTRIAVANVDGRLFAIDEMCTHEHCSLVEEGALEGRSSPVAATALNSTSGQGRCWRRRRSNRCASIRCMSIATTSSSRCKCRRLLSSSAQAWPEPPRL